MRLREFLLRNALCLYRRILPLSRFPTAKGDNRFRKRTQPSLSGAPPGPPSTFPVFRAFQRPHSRPCSPRSCRRTSWHGAGRIPDLSICPGLSDRSCPSDMCRNALKHSGFVGSLPDPAPGWSPIMSTRREAVVLKCWEAPGNRLIPSQVFHPGAPHKFVPVSCANHQQMYLPHVTPVHAYTADPSGYRTGFLNCHPVIRPD